MEQYLDGITKEVTMMDNAHKKMIQEYDVIFKNDHYANGYKMEQFKKMDDAFVEQTKVNVENARNIVGVLEKMIAIQEATAISTDTNILAAAKLIQDGIVTQSQIHQLARQFSGNVAALKLLDQATMNNPKYKDVNLKTYWVHATDIAEIRLAIGKSVANRDYGKVNRIIHDLKCRLRGEQVEKGFYSDLI